MLKFGNISEVDAAKGLARVKFNDDDIVSGWLPMMVRKTLKEKESCPFDVNEHVCCLMDETCDNGVILGAIYSKNETPGLTNKDEFGTKYDNGDEEKYNRQSRERLVKVGTSEHKITNAGGHTIKKGAESLKAILNDILTQLQSETHPTPVGPTGPPVNAAAYAAIAARLSALFEG